MLTNLRLWLRHLFAPAGYVDLTVVRRYNTPTGYVGELYLNKKQIGLTLDNSGFVGHSWLEYRMNGLYTGQQMRMIVGDFMDRLPENTMFYHGVDLPRVLVNVRVIGVEFVNDYAFEMQSLSLNAPRN